MPLKLPTPQAIVIKEISLTWGDHPGTNLNFLKALDPEQKQTEFPNNRDLIKFKKGLLWPDCVSLGKPY